MFVPLWLVFLGSGLLMAVITIVWAIRSNQFDEQKRARFIPLQGLSAQELARQPVRKRRAERVGLWVVVFSGVGAILAGLLLVVSHG